MTSRVRSPGGAEPRPDLDVRSASRLYRAQHLRPRIPNFLGSGPSTIGREAQTLKVSSIDSVLFYCFKKCHLEKISFAWEPRGELARFCSSESSPRGPLSYPALYPHAGGVSRIARPWYLGDFFYPAPSTGQTQTQLAKLFRNFSNSDCPRSHRPRLTGGSRTPRPSDRHSVTRLLPVRRPACAVPRGYGTLPRLPG